MIILNFGHPLTPEHLEALESATGQAPMREQGILDADLRLKTGWGGQK